MVNVKGWKTYERVYQRFLGVHKIYIECKKEVQRVVTLEEDSVFFLVDGSVGIFEDSIGLPGNTSLRNIFTWSMSSVISSRGGISKCTKIIIYGQWKINYMSPFKHNKTVSFTVKMMALHFVSQVINPFAPGNFSQKCILKLVKRFSGHCCAVMS